uniref:(northern house mosquito) hypothetical protein n=1 Tax=Culex pipiens TaxID=7175 RepID=A0A8D8DH09_CULPI
MFINICQKSAVVDVFILNHGNLSPSKANAVGICEIFPKQPISEHGPLPNLQPASSDLRQQPRRASKPSSLVVQWCRQRTVFRAECANMTAPVLETMPGGQL